MTPKRHVDTVPVLAGGRDVVTSEHCFGDSFTWVVTRPAIDSQVRLDKLGNCNKLIQRTWTNKGAPQLSAVAQDDAKTRIDCLEPLDRPET